MKYSVIIRPEAEEDLKQAFSWYEEKRKGLGHDFLLQIDAGLRLIGRNPELYPAKYKGTRNHLVKRFPFRVVYLTEEQRVIVLGVLHEKRHPEVAEKRKTDI